MNEEDAVFKALADGTRRHLLDRLFLSDGLTQSELEADLPISRFGVAKHLQILENAALITARRSGRRKLHFLNPVPIRQIHDRWIDKYTEAPVSALTGLKHELEHDDDHDRARDRDPGVPDLHPGDAAGDLGRDHEARVH